MMKRGVKDLSVIAILLIISQVFCGVVSAVDGSEDFIGSVAYALGSHGNDNVIPDEEYSDSVLAMFAADASAEAEYTFVTMWQELPQPWYFNVPEDIAVDGSGYVYVADTLNHRIQKFDSSGNFITKWGSSGDGDGEFDYPHSIAVDSSGYVFVADSSNDRIQKFDSSGNFITKWGGEGTGDGEFYWPTGIAVDCSGYVYVADPDNNRIQKFDSNGNFITKWGNEGMGDGEFYYPGGIAVDSSGNVYFTDYNNDRIQKFDAYGNFITKWGSKGTGDGEFNVPSVMSTFKCRIKAR